MFQSIGDGYSKRYTHNDVIQDIIGIKKFASDTAVKEDEADGLFALLKAAGEAASIKSMDQTSQTLFQTVSMLRWSLDRLKNHGINVTNQLQQMHQGDVAFGVPNEDTRFYKDFEFEILVGAALCEAFPKLILGQKNNEYDLDLGNLVVECKHPNTNDILTIQTYIADFNAKLFRDDKYGMFCIAVEDMFQTQAQPPQKMEEINSRESLLWANVNRVLSAMLVPFICSQKRILAVVTAWTFSNWVDEKNDAVMRLSRFFNGNFIDRSLKSQLKQEKALNATFSALRAFPTIHKISCDDISQRWQLSLTDSQGV